MKAKIIFENGGTADIDLTTEQEKAIEKLQGKKKTGYERVNLSENYFIFDSTEENGIFETGEDCEYMDDCNYKCADYHSDETVAINNARADKLMRQLRRFAVENAENELNWKDGIQGKWYIYYSYQEQEINLSYKQITREFYQIFFDSQETCQKAIDTYKDELLWYFTEYRDRV